jgi:hypothetical protein
MGLVNGETRGQDHEGLPPGHLGKKGTSAGIHVYDTVLSQHYHHHLFLLLYTTLHLSTRTLSPVVYT